MNFHISTVVYTMDNICMFTHTHTHRERDKEGRVLTHRDAYSDHIQCFGTEFANLLVLVVHQLQQVVSCLCSSRSRGLLNFVTYTVTVHDVHDVL